MRKWRRYFSDLSSVSFFQLVHKLYLTLNETILLAVLIFRDLYWDFIFYVSIFETETKTGLVSYRGSKTDTVCLQAELIMFSFLSDSKNTAMYLLRTDLCPSHETVDFQNSDNSCSRILVVFKKGGKLIIFPIWVENNFQEIIITMTMIIFITLFS